MRVAVLTVALITLCSCATSADTPATSYAVTTHWPVAGEGRWDLLDVDPAAHRLYLSRSDRVQVLDTTTGKLVGEVPGTDGVHGIAVVSSLGRGFATDGRSDRVTEFDLRTLAVLRTIPVSGHSPDAVLFDPHSRHLYAFNARSNNASVIDPIAGKEVATLAFVGNPELAASDGAGHVFVNLESSGAVVDIDSNTSRIAHTWTLDGCDGPTGLGLDVRHARLFSACANGVMAVTDARDGHAIARVPIGEGPDGLAFDAARGDVLVPNGRSGTLTLIHEDAPDHYVVRQTIPTRAGARTIALDPMSHRAYLPTAQFGPKPAGDADARPPMIPGSFEVVVVGVGH
ncbi:YncE family protein [Cognatilysobacter terrigena]|uniref:YncE family protein n=1 Tax=Cognatilysobacter terrigena TaxID=2488749 RepID=UPI00105DC891|nr:YncE family protein [Lysobacter terrigena]